MATYMLSASYQKQPGKKIDYLPRGCIEALGITGLIGDDGRGGKHRRNGDCDKNGNIAKFAQLFAERK